MATKPQLKRGIKKKEMLTERCLSYVAEAKIHSVYTLLVTCSVRSVTGLFFHIFMSRNNV